MLKCLFPRVSPLLLINNKCVSHFCRETANKNKHFKVTKTLIFNSDKAFKGTVVNRALPSLNRGFLEITRTVPLNTFNSLFGT